MSRWNDSRSEIEIQLDEYREQKKIEAESAAHAAEAGEQIAKFLLIPITGTVAIVKAARSDMPKSKKVKTYVINGILMAVWIAVIAIVVINAKKA